MPGMLTAGKSQSSQGGFTYLIVMGATAAILIAAGVAAQVASYVAEIGLEEELLYRGLAYKKAIESYYLAGNEKKKLPPQLEDLLIDPRFPNVRRHIRALYKDPLDSGTGWQLIRGLDGGIAGVASQSTKRPWRKAGFPTGMEQFAKARSYQGWIFAYVPAATERPDKAAKLLDKN